MNPTKQSHTKTPWNYEVLSQYSKNCISIYSGSVCIINSGVDNEGKQSEIYGVLKEEDALFIVKAVNNHDRLVEALKECLRHLDRENSVIQSHAIDHACSLAEKALENIRQAEE